MAKTGRPPKYPWDTMEVGEIFQVDVVGVASANTMALRACKRYYPKRFSAMARLPGLQVEYESPLYFIERLSDDADND